MGSLTWGDRADVQLNETLLATDVLSPLLCQNVRTTGVSTAEPEGLRMATTITVITVSALDGSVSRGLPAQEWQHHVYLYRRCGTYYPGWPNGGHPTVADGQVTRTVCFNSGYNCCYYSRSIKVRNCGSYYVYYLNGTPTCNARYCGTN